MCSQQIQLIVFIEMLPEVTEGKVFSINSLKKLQTVNYIFVNIIVGVALFVWRMFDSSKLRFRA